MKKLIRNISLMLLATGSITHSVFASPEHYKVDTAQSQVQWTGEKVTGSHHGTLAIKSGEVVVEGAKLMGGTFELAMNTIKDVDIDDPAYNKKLTDHLYSPDFFDVSKYPTSTFTITAAELLPSPEAGSPNYTITGDLKIKGVSFPITFSATITIGEEEAVAAASTKVDRTKYNIRYGSGKFFENLGDKLIYDEFKVDLNLVAKKA